MLENKQIFYSFIKKYLPWLALGLALFLTNSQHRLGSDEGAILNAAWNIYHDRKLYYDTFEFIAPGAPYLLAWWWQLTAPSYLMAAFLGYLISFSSLVGLFLISQQLKIKRWKFLAPTLFIIASSFWQLLDHNNLNIAAIIWSLYFLLVGLDKDKEKLFLSGLFSGLAVLFTQHRGLIAGVIFIIYLLILKIKREIPLSKIIIFISGFVLPLLSLFIFWEPKILYDSLIKFPFLNYHETNVLPLTLWYWSLAGLLLVIILIYKKTRPDNKNRLILFSLLNFGLLLSALTRPDASHILQSLISFLILIAWLLEIYIYKLRYQLIIYTLLLFIIMFRCLWPPLENLNVWYLVKTIKKVCPNSEKIYVGPFMPGVYFQMRTLSITPYGFLITNQHTSEQFNKALEIIKQEPPSCAILNYSLVEKFNYNKNNPLDNFFKEEYTVVRELGDITILIKK